MDIEFSLPLSVGIVAAIIAAATAGLLGADMMTTATTLTMVLPSMILFALVVFLVGLKHGEYRASN